MKSLTFKVTHGAWSAELQAPANCSLHDLAETVIDAVGFDLDHCFGFYDNLKRYFNSTEEYTLFADIGEEAKESDTGVQGTSIESVFEPGKEMLFLFDYGDNWMFPVRCTGEVEAKPFKRPKVLSTSGEPPVQYPPYEEEV